MNKNTSKKSIVSSKNNYDLDLLQNMYKKMLLIRRFEEKAGQLYGMGKIGGFCHLYIGQEAVVVGVQSVQIEGDSVVTSYRDHGHMLACDMDPKGVMAELTGREDGYSKGKGGSMHMFSREKGFFGGHGIVAAQVPIGAGLAFAHKYNGNKNVAITYFGDGAANQGQVYESYNIAALWKLPVIFVIENNKYGMGTSVNRSSAGDNLSDRGKAYGIVADIVDGMDVIAVRDAALKAMDYCRSGKGPYILEMKTYRYRGHSMSDPAKYRTRDEVDEIRQNSDPINNIKSILDKFGLKDENLKIIDTEIKSIIANAATFAQESPEPSEAELFTDITIN
ncbi:MAG: pyruvate dehydrogenase (acetyl-transferring) E1 component subunit alpha [Alphaproteobacteria bacterium]|jgi:pyruvate dehydrogenase E1 component alpha subunit|nr:pyruvate dehydrogenase (acetyl-transferring) E1 component subunit alpha [Alphaproteobacteria bacterium]MDG2458776.1 pyruvate dehydrogenase (acetyl-transferring) E1 component subunit alpha [Alphaproteobacteria bacterium]|tara:strand:- start:23 stop:1027 length:1005 start_codon:yes stop_codon:yes gene_type:complete